MSRHLLMYVVAVLVYAADQGLKWLVRTQMGLHQEIVIVPNVLVIDYIRNPGGAFGIFPNARVLFILVALLVVGVGVYVERRHRPNVWVKLGLGLLLAGALGNLTDRAVAGTVVDYIYIQAINFPVFNLADMAIDSGIILLLLRGLWSRSDSEKEAKR